MLLQGLPFQYQKKQKPLSQTHRLVLIIMVIVLIHAVEFDSLGALVCRQKWLCHGEVKKGQKLSLFIIIMIIR